MNDKHRVLARGIGPRIYAYVFCKHIVTNLVKKKMKYNLEKKRMKLVMWNTLLEM